MATDKREAIEVDSLKIDGNLIPATSAQEFSADFGDGAAIVFTIPHGLTRTRLTATVILNSTGEEVYVDKTIDATNVVITFVGTPPTSNQFKVIVK